MITRALLMLALVSAVLPAQSRRGVPIPEPGGERRLEPAEVKAINPARILLDLNGLDLGARQRIALDGLAKRYDSPIGDLVGEVRNRQRLVRIPPPNSPRPPYPTPSGEDSVKQAKYNRTHQERWDRWNEDIARARVALAEGLLAIKKLHDSSTTEAVAVLTEEQRMRAAAAIGECRETLAALISRSNFR